MDEKATRIRVEDAKSVQEWYAIEMEALGCDKDHMHALVSAHHKIALGRMERIFKSMPAWEIFRRKPSGERNSQPMVL